MENWHWIDYAIMVILALSVLTGLIRGFVKELIALGVWVAAGVMSFYYAKPVSLWLATYIQDPSLRVILAYVLIVVGTLIAGSLVSSTIAFMMHRSGLSGTDRLLGVGFGMIRGVFVISLLMVVIRVTGMPEEDYQEKSKLYHYFDPVVSWMYQYTPDMIKRVEHLEQKAVSEADDTVAIQVREFSSL